jgi:hypothetical protein
MKESFQPQKNTGSKFESYRESNDSKPEQKEEMPKKADLDKEEEKLQEKGGYEITNPGLLKTIERIKEKIKKGEDPRPKETEKETVKEKTKENPKPKSESKAKTKSKSKVKSVENTKTYSSESEIREEIKAYEQQITQIERGEKGYNDKSGELSTIDQLHKKIAEAENKLRGLENQKNGDEEGDLDDALENDDSGVYNPDDDEENGPIPPKPEKDEDTEPQLKPQPQPEPVQPPKPPEPPEEPPEEPKSIEEIENELNASRNNFIEQYRSFIANRKAEGHNVKKEPEDSELTPELLEARQEYTKRKVELGKILLRDKKVELEESGEKDVLSKLKEYKSSEIYDRVILNEYDILTEAKAELWKPKEKTIFKKAFDWYSRQSRIKKVAIGSAIATGGAVIGGGLTLPATALFAGSYMVRGFLSASVGMLAGEAFSKIVKDKSGENYEEALEELRNDFRVGGGDTYFEEDNLQEIIKNRDSQRAKYNILKGLIIFASSTLVGSGLRSLEQSMINSSAQDFEAATAKATAYTSAVESANEPLTTEGIEIPEIKPMDDPFFNRSDFGNGDSGPINITNEQIVSDYNYNPYEQINNQAQPIPPEPTAGQEAVQQAVKQPDHGRSIRRTFQNRNMFSRGMKITY